MKLQRALTLLLPLSLFTACIDETEQLADTDSELSTADWGPGQGLFTPSYYGAAIATLNGISYLVHTGGINDKQLYWRTKNDSIGSWSQPQPIPGQKTSDQVSLAAFNGSLYMVHIGETDRSAVWFSRFDPWSQTWVPNEKLNLTTSIGAPALAAFDGRLWIVGAHEDLNGNHQLWVSTMLAGGRPSGAANIGRRTTSTRPSLAVFANKLFVAHGVGEDIVTMTHAAGAYATVWSATSPVKAGPWGATIRGDEPKLASVNGYLHLVHRRAGDGVTFWTTWNQCTWAPEQPIDYLASYHPLSLTTGGPGLQLVRDDYALFEGVWTHRPFITNYWAPPPPITVPQCTGTVGTVQ